MAMLLIRIRNRSAASHSQSPCMLVETITAGNATAGRGSTAHNNIVCVPPPLAPVTPMRVGSTSGSDERKSRARIELNVCSPSMLCSRNSASASVKPLPWTIGWLSAYPTMS